MFFRNISLIRDLKQLLLIREAIAEVCILYYTDQ